MSPPDQTPQQPIAPAPVAPTPVTVGAIPWYKSPQQIGLITTAVSAIVAIFPKIGQALGLSSPSDAANAVTNFFGVIAVIAPIIGSIMRARSPLQPLTLTQSEANTHPASVAVVKAQDAAAPISTKQELHL